MIPISRARKSDMNHGGMAESIGNFLHVIDVRPETATSRDNRKARSLSYHEGTGSERLRPKVPDLDMLFGRPRRPSLFSNEAAAAVMLPRVAQHRRDVLTVQLRL